MIVSVHDSIDPFPPPPKYDLRIEIEIKGINISAAVVDQDNNTASLTRQTSLLIRGDTPKPGWFWVGIYTFLRGEIDTGISEIIQLIQVVERQW